MGKRMSSTMAKMYQEPEFSIFGKLPKELRLTIWELTIAPRVVNLSCSPIASTYLEWYLKKLGWDKSLPIYTAGELPSFVEAGLNRVPRKHNVSLSEMKRLETQVYQAMKLLTSGRSWDANKRFNLRSIATAYIIAGIESQHLIALLKLSGAIDLEVLMNYTSNTPPDDSPPALQEALWDIYDVRRDEFDLLSPIYGLKSGSIPPSILYACRESREVALKHYEMGFITHEGLQGTYFDFQNDILFLGYDQFLEEDQDIFQVNSAFNMLEGHFINLLWGCVDQDNMSRVRNVAYLVRTSYYLTRFSPVWSLNLYLYIPHFPN
jgi:hypothetical protein